MEPEKDEDKKEDKAGIIGQKFLILVVILIVILFLLFAIWIIWALVIDKSGQAEKTSTEESETTIIPSSEVEDLVSDPAPLSSSRAVKDKDGLIYYGFDQLDQKSIMVLDKEGKIHERWSSTSEKNIEIAGIDEDRVIFFFTDKTDVSCEEAWSTDHTYYGVGFGTVSYSGAAGLLLEQNEQLIADIREKCK
ncbi:hypothetical protein KJ903_00015 [Patescibacteria group bacterium]|nr:hypothetical protein [Patescibacteria group bacterium]